MDERANYYDEYRNTVPTCDEWSVHIHRKVLSMNERFIYTRHWWSVVAFTWICILWDDEDSIYNELLIPLICILRKLIIRWKGKKFNAPLIEKEAKGWRGKRMLTQIGSEWGRRNAVCWWDENTFAHSEWNVPAKGSLMQWMDKRSAWREEKISTESRDCSFVTILSAI